MALLQASNAVFYHPLDNRVETLQGKTWSLYGATNSIAAFGRPFITSGLYNNDSSAGTIYGNTSDYGGYPSGASSITAAFWMSGITTNNQVIVGWGTTSFVSIKAGVGLRHQNSDTSVKVLVYASGTSLWTGPALTIPADPSWIVVRASWSGENLFYAWASFNGGEWQFAGSGERYKPDATGSLVGINTYESTTGGKIGIDEVVLWKDAEMFSSRELERLYLLSNTDGKPMNEFTQNYGWTIVQSSGNLFIHGQDSSSGSMTLYSSQGFAFGMAPMFCCNDTWISGSMPLYTNSPTYYDQDHLQWYHPLSNNTREQFRNKTWNSWAWRVPPTYGPYANTPVFGMAARGYGLAPATTQVLGSVDSIYTSGSASGSLPLPWLMTQWVSGLCRTSAFIRQGWASTSVVKSEFPFNTLTDFVSFSKHSSSGMKVAVYGGKRLAVSGILPYSERAFSEWHFIAAYAEYRYSGDDVIGLDLWVSLDANPWMLLGSATGSTFLLGTYDQPPTYPQIEMQDVVSAPFTPSGAIDEVACWKGIAGCPTQQAVRTLYETTRRGLGLDQFYAVDTGFELATMPMFISGPVLSSGSCDLHIQHNPRNSIPLFVSGLTPYGQWPMFLQTEHTTTSGSVGLCTHGSASGDVFGHSSSMPMYVGYVPDEDDEWWYHPTYTAGPSSWSMFMKAASWSGTVAVSGSWSLIMKMGGLTSGCCDLSLTGTDGTITGRTIYSGITLAMTGWHPGQLDDDLSAGFYPVLSGFPMVLARTRGATGNLGLAVSGFAWPSGSIALSTMGVIGTVSGSISMFAATYATVSETCACWMNGYTGGSSGSMPIVLSLPETGVVHTPTGCRLYVHGY